MNCFVYLDDVFVFSSLFEGQISRLYTAFQRLEESHLKLNPTNGTFLKSEVNYQGYVVLKEGLHPEPGRIEIAQRYPVPSDVTLLKILGDCRVL